MLDYHSLFKMPGSLKIFQSFIHRSGSSGSEGTDIIDVSQVFSLECMEEWASYKGFFPQGGEMENETWISESFTIFRRTLLSHITGSDNKTPFEIAEEAALLKWLRGPDPWGAFREVAATESMSIFRSLGYHERLASSTDTDTVQREDAPSRDPSVRTRRQTPPLISKRKRGSARKNSDEASDDPSPPTRTYQLYFAPSDSTQSPKLGKGDDTIGATSPSPKKLAMVDQESTGSSGGPAETSDENSKKDKQSVEGSDSSFETAPK